MKFSEMSYTRPDIDALLGQCKALAAKAAGAASGEELVNVYYEQSRAFADYSTAAQKFGEDKVNALQASTTPATPVTLIGRPSRTSLMPTVPPWRTHGWRSAGHFWPTPMWTR